MRYAYRILVFIRIASRLLEQAVEAARPLYEAWQREAKQLAAKQHGVGSTVAW